MGFRGEPVLVRFGTMFEPVQPKYIKAVAGFSSIFYIPFSLSLLFSSHLANSLFSLLSSSSSPIGEMVAGGGSDAVAGEPSRRRTGAKKALFLIFFFFCAFSRLPPLYTVCVCVSGLLTVTVLGRGGCFDELLC